MRGPQHRAAGEIYIQVSNIYQEGGEEVKALEYLETALDCFVKAGEKVIAAKISEDVLRLTLCQDYSDSDVIEKVTIILKHARQLFAIFFLVCRAKAQFPAGNYILYDCIFYDKIEII